MTPSEKIKLLKKVYYKFYENNIQIFEFNESEDEDFIKIIDNTSFGMEFNYKNRRIDIVLDSNLLNSKGKLDGDLFACDKKEAKEILKHVLPLIWESDLFDIVVIIPQIRDGDTPFAEEVIYKPKNNRFQ